jgi:hypothetical protein
MIASAEDFKRDVESDDEAAFALAGDESTHKDKGQ